MRPSKVQGFTLVEVLVALLIVSVLTLACGTLLANLQDYIHKFQDSSSRALSWYQLTDRINGNSDFISSLALTPENDKLRVCTYGGSLGACAGDCCSTLESNEFVILDSTDTNPNLSLRRRLVGTSSKPALYTAQGELCVTAGQNCIYEITGSFSSVCPGSLESCDKAELFILDLQIKSNGATVPLKDRNLRIHYAPVSNAKPLVNPTAAQTLNVGQKLRVPVYANSGHAQENQDLLFNSCLSSDPSVVKVTCYGFINGTAMAILEAIKIGTAKIDLQVNDTGEANNLSDISSFQVQVNP
ncbi:type IV pilus modification PilV family protein [Bdellovibrio svalbardensis]|uniref:Prepilin-type N-terminal cleavage/methylation domain-containing protein n=1 Tax=Bdellovibrio svalbardensis TaxID=2972972 RepID=A0ABT6DNE3_9BACT|nr:prepilin-type N-terminal cleavage/methylation domain-containing protein [Bdellovibrio svalbardensis]MDG0818027.1 prepilin-type N-terminal cleavage/methylation domain-containing protein [Bdellovibrio svalbardensis]